MMNDLKVCGAGLLISWLGALPLGTLNITAFDIAASQNVQNALLFALSAVVIELLYVRLSLWGSSKISMNQRWISYLLPAGALLLAYLAIGSFREALVPLSSSKEVSQTSILGSPILLGLSLSALNPLQIPFWLAWSKVLQSKRLLKDTSRSRMFFILGIGLGTLLALGIFIYLGHNVIQNFEGYTLWVNSILGVIYMGFSFYLLFVFFRKRLKLKFQ
ncbi:MAG: LysE family transporter [Bacteroidota bacterium]